MSIAPTLRTLPETMRTHCRQQAHMIARKAPITMTPGLISVMIPLIVIIPGHAVISVMELFELDHRRID